MVEQLKCIGTLSVGGEICRPILYFFYLCIGTNKPMIDAIAPRVNIVVENNLYWKLEQLIQQKTKYEIV